MKMAKQMLTLRVLFFGLIALIMVPALPSFAATDSDGDGISDSAEINGWSNKSGGPYHTDPHNADTDGDGLTDGEEKLFNTKPLSTQSPGIYARYNNAFRSNKYYSWVKYGDKYLAHGDDIYKTIIVRRGATLLVGGLPGATLQITKSLAALTTLSAVPNADGIRWTITIPGDGTAGKYTLKLTSGSWSKTLKLYVIFEIPSNLSAASAAAYLYADDPGDDRDRYSVWFDTNPLKNESLDPSYEYFGWPYAFRTDQYQQYVFEGYVIDAVNGTSTQQAAFEALAHKTDQVTRFDANVWNTNMSAALSSFQSRNDCSRIADVAVGFMRSAGIAAHTILSDAIITHYDTSLEGWVGGRWLTVRAYNNSGETDIANPIEGGIYGPYTQYEYGHNKYTTAKTAMLMTMGPNWQWSEVNNANHCSNAGKKAYKAWFLPEMGQESPPRAPGNIDRVAGWLSLTVPYWGWPSEPSTSKLLSYGCTTSALGMPIATPPDGLPLRLSQSAGQLPSALSGGLIYGLWILPLIGLLAFLGARSRSWKLAGGVLTLFVLSAALLLDPSMLSLGQAQTQPQPARLGKVVADYGVDTNGNGRYDALVVEVQVQVRRPGSYTLIGHLDDSTPTPYVVGGHLATASTYAALNAGSQVVKLQFRGQTIYQNGEDGSYSLEELWLTDQKYPEEADLPDNAADHQHPGYRTSAYSRNSFENGGASLSGSYSHTALDANQDGYFDSLLVDTSLAVNTPGLYRVTAELADAQGTLVAVAGWTGSSNPVVLPFQALLGDATPYYLRNVNLYDAQGELIDSTSESDSPDLGVYATGPLYNLGLGNLDPQYASLHVANAKAKEGSGVDFHGYEVSVNTAIVVEGDYRLEAWLEGSDGEPFAWEQSEPVHLTPGLRDLSLSFKERKIKAFKAKSPYKLVALKLLYGNAYTVVDQLDIAFDPVSAVKH